MDNLNSPLDTLRQLKEMLDAGAITPTEFEALKQRLVFTAPATTAAPAAPVVPEFSAPAPVVPPPPPAFDRPLVAAAPQLPLAEEAPAIEPAYFAAEPEPLLEPEPEPEPPGAPATSFRPWPKNRPATRWP